MTQFQTLFGSAKLLVEIRRCFYEGITVVLWELADGLKSYVGLEVWKVR